jgi:cytochrome c-type biogenesis protein CcmH
LPAPPTVAGSTRENFSPQQIEAMIEKVKERLAARPDDLEGWTLLARTYAALGRASEAVPAFERAASLSPNDADLLADYADAVGVAQGRSLHGKPEELITRALRANPLQWKANALAGTIAFQRGDAHKAIEHWERVKANVPPDSPVARGIDASLADARDLAAKGGASGAIAPKAKVAGTVALASPLASGVAPDDTVFVYARPTDGSRMPLALVRAKAKDLPLAFTLDDSTAMLPTRKLSDHADVIVGARLSKSGSATPQAGDLEAEPAPATLGAIGVKLVIDRRLP